MTGPRPLRIGGWCAQLAGAAPLVVTFHGTDVRHRIVGPMSTFDPKDRLGRRRLESPVRGKRRDGPGCRCQKAGAPFCHAGADLCRFSRVDRKKSPAEFLGLTRMSRSCSFPPTRRDRKRDSIGPSNSPMPRMPSWSAVVGSSPTACHSG